MRLLFAGSPKIAVPSLLALSDLESEGNGIVLAGVLTNPDRSRRHGNAEPSDVSSAVLALNAARQKVGLAPIPQIKPEKLDSNARSAVADLSPDLLVSFAYGKFFGPRFLSLFPVGGINIHPSLLPKFRGASPVPAAILGREKETGICIQKLAPNMDTGDILASDRFALTGRETSASLSETVSGRAALLLCRVIRNFEKMSAAARLQEGEAVYCREIAKDAGIIDWNKSAPEIDAQIRAYTPWPLSSTRRGNDTLIILEAKPMDNSCVKAEQAKTAPPGTILGTDREYGILIQTGDGILAVSRLQWQAKKALDWKAFCNGARDFLKADMPLG